MLQVFGVLCGLDQEIISVLLGSILPNELGRDINNHLTGQSSPSPSPPLPSLSLPSLSLPLIPILKLLYIYYNNRD